MAQPKKISASIMNQNLSFPRALTVSVRFSPVARCSSLRISGLCEISYAVPAITIKIAFSEKMGAPILVSGTMVWEAAEVPGGIDSHMCCRTPMLQSYLPDRLSGRVVFSHVRFAARLAALFCGRKR